MALGAVEKTPPPPPAQDTTHHGYPPPYWICRNLVQWKHWRLMDQQRAGWVTAHSNAAVNFFVILEQPFKPLVCLVVVRRRLFSTCLSEVNLRWATCLLPRFTKQNKTVGLLVDIQYQNYYKRQISAERTLEHKLAKNLSRHLVPLWVGFPVLCRNVFKKAEPDPQVTHLDIASPPHT